MAYVFSIATLTAAVVLVGFSIAQQQRGSARTQENPADLVSSQSTNKNSKKSTIVNPAKLETITLGAGCFWCVEAVFQEIDGVISVTSGYSNGDIVNPTYEQVCSGDSGCVEVAQIVFDPSKVSLGKILHVFWRTHNPTTLNRQGGDTGTQYRSGIYYHNEVQKVYAEMYKAKINEVNAFGKPVVTEILPVKNFTVAEDYHQNYYLDNPNSRYCRNVIVPKLKKFRAVFSDVLKDEKE